MTVAIATLGQLFGELQDNTTMITLIGPLLVYRGDSATYLLTVVDDKDKRVNLTGATIELQIARSLGAALKLVSLAVGTGITLLDQSAADTKGQATCEITSEQLDVAIGLCYLDVVIVDGADRKHVIAPREFTIAGVVNSPAV